MSFYEGMELFIEDLQEYAKAADDAHVAEVLMVGGEALAADVRRLPKPRRTGGGYTHMLDSVTAVENGATVLVGWGKYYGPFVEHGTKKMKEQPHLVPTWDANKERYYKLMAEKLFGRR